MNDAPKLRILPAESELIKAEVETISAMPLVGSLTAAAFVAVDLAVMNGSNFICTCRSHTMARRIANALNRYAPGRKGY